MKTSIHKWFIYINAGVLALTSVILVTGCSQKPSAEQNEVQIQAAVDKAVEETKQQFAADQAAEKAKQDAAAQAEEKLKQDAAAQAEEKRKQDAIAAAKKKQRLAEQRKGAEIAKSQSLPPPPVKEQVCANCGVVVSINPVEAEGKGSGLGVIAGGVLGGLLGNQVGNGTGRDLATVAGAVGGAFAGNKVEKKVKKTTSYDITVKMDSGGTRTFNQVTEPGLVVDQRVKIENDQVVKF